jgi:hypothetical protein
MGLYNACNNSLFRGGLYDNRVLYNRGVKWDTILHVGGFMGVANTFSTVSKQKTWIEGNLPPSSQPLDDAKFLKILLNDSYTKQSAFSKIFRATQKHYQDCRVWWDTGNLGQDKRKLSKENWEGFINVETTISANILCRRFFITSNGSIGIGPPGMRVGDEVWILCGGMVPYVLRRSEETFSLPDLDIVDQPCHTLAGESYVDGIMDGEASEGIQTDVSSAAVFLV